MVFTRFFVLLLGFIMTGVFAVSDSREPSPHPPGGLTPEQVPQFVMIGFDDNPQVEPMSWIIDHAAELKNPAGAGQTDTADGKPVRFAFLREDTDTAKLAGCLVGAVFGIRVMSRTQETSEKIGSVAAATLESLLAPWEQVAA